MAVRLTANRTDVSTDEGGQRVSLDTKTNGLSSAGLLRAVVSKLALKVLLTANGCRDGFWLGNLKHKDLEGKETSSQMAVAVLMSSILLTAIMPPNADSGSVANAFK